MSRKAVTIFFCFGLLMTFSSLRADVLKKKDNGTIVAVGQMRGADEKTIYWETCDGNDTTFAPRNGYLYKTGNNDCTSRATNQYPNGESRDRDDKSEWREVPVTRDEKRGR
ncbi:MAG: hypothetical protein ACXV78_02225 [Candidatus Angelobacter sp.]